jgi:hypothetical protein
MSLSKTLLTGVALCAFAAVPAMAADHAPNISLASKLLPSLKLKTGAVHFKTNIHDPKYTNVTETVTFEGTITRTNFYKTKVLLWLDGWITHTSTSTTSKCEAIPKQTAKFPAKSKAKSLLAAASATATASDPGFCVATPGITLYGPDYTLESKTAKSDSFKGTISKKHYSGYNLKLVVNTDINID